MGTATHVLLIENDEANAKPLVELFAGLAPKLYQLEICTYYEAGLMAALSSDYELILVAETLGIHSAKVFLQELRKQLPDHPPAIVLLDKEQPDSEATAAAEACGAVDYLFSKHLKQDMLCRVLKQNLQLAELESELHASQERYQRVAEGANDCLWDLNLENHQISFSPRWQSHFGYNDNATGPVQKLWFERIHKDDRDAFDTALTEHIQGNTAYFESEQRLLSQQGDWLWTTCHGLRNLAPDGTMHLAGSITDISKNKAIENQLQHEAGHDPLTGMPNRNLLTDRIRTALARTKRQSHYRFAVLFIDFDHFKTVNDSLGHVAGDKLLVTIAKRLAKSMRDTDTVSRIGGDEFAVLVEDAGNVNDVLTVAEKVLVTIGTEVNLGSNAITVTGSIGIAIGSEDYLQVDDILRDADTAMYRAKSAGRNRYEIFDASMQAKAAGLRETVSDLEETLEKKAFVLHYQPIVALDSGKVQGIEALLRWPRPGHGLLKPEAFIAVAEENNLIEPISIWVLEQALADLKEVNNNCTGDHLPYVSVNLSAINFKKIDLAKVIRQALDKTQLQAKQLVIEMTEITLLQQRASAYVALKAVRALGVKVCIDDFGTGYSSLSYLHQFSFDALKIDESFVNNIETQRHSLAIVRSIIALAKSLNLDIIAEGVETELQRRVLQIQGCTQGQGHLFSNALPTEELVDYLAI